ncbi:MAG: glycine--tRNA ligase subunit beta [Thermoleophilia bacterium]|nr:glycine--tRNA ligase subunit beta [Thermoleophilia bacterium]
MPSLLLEIGCEELPAAACREAERQLPALAREHLGAEPAELYVGPRRLGFLVRELPERTPDEWIKGPPQALRERAADGFARRHGVSAEQLTVRDGFLGFERPGRALREVLPDRLAAVVRGVEFAKSMRWDESGLRFARPVRWLCALLDAEPVPVALETIPAGRTSFGHRFASGRVEVAAAEAYVGTLREALVEPIVEERRARIVAALDAIGGWSDPGGALEEVVHLAENPAVLVGEFDETLLRLPERVVVTAMQSHQRYFPLGGNRFAFVANGGDPDVVRAGNENVLENRLEDADFTFERDLAVGIDALAERLGAITFLAGAGSFADKTERLVRLVDELGGDETAREAARLAKADQAAELVREFPELEGHIGAQYARAAGYAEPICAAIDEHYLPDSADAPLPATPAGRLVAVADRIDLLNVAFRLGRRPTGSRDPFGLRRAAIGVCRLATEGGVVVPRSLLVPDARDFVEERFEALLRVPVEFVRAARAAPAADAGAVARHAEALADAAGSDVFAAAYEVHDRAHRIAGRREAEAAAELDPALLRDDAERALAERVGSLSLRPDGDVRASLAEAATLAPLVERFFDEVLVLADDPALRANRLRLLLELRDKLRALGDLSQIPV